MQKRISAFTLVASVILTGCATGPSIRYSEAMFERRAARERFLSR